MLAVTCRSVQVLARLALRHPHQAAQLLWGLVLAAACLAIQLRLRHRLHLVVHSGPRWRSSHSKGLAYSALQHQGQAAVYSARRRQLQPLEACSEHLHRLLRQVASLAPPLLRL